jgi:hypothetical protein
MSAIKLVTEHANFLSEPFEELFAKLPLGKIDDISFALNETVRPWTSFQVPRWKLMHSHPTHN